MTHATIVKRGNAREREREMLSSLMIMAICRAASLLNLKSSLFFYCLATRSRMSDTIIFHSWMVSLSVDWPLVYLSRSISNTPVRWQIQWWSPLSFSLLDTDVTDFSLSCESDLVDVKTITFHACSCASIDMLRSYYRWDTGARYSFLCFAFIRSTLYSALLLVADWTRVDTHTQGKWQDLCTADHIENEVIIDNDIPVVSLERRLSTEKDFFSLTYLFTFFSVGNCWCQQRPTDRQRCSSRATPSERTDRNRMRLVEDDEKNVKRSLTMFSNLAS